MLEEASVVKYRRVEVHRTSPAHRLLHRRLALCSLCSTDSPSIIAVFNLHRSSRNGPS